MNTPHYTVDHHAAAMASHEANRAWCLINGDQSQPHWEDAPEWQKESALKGVETILNNPSVTPEHLHNSWLAQKRVEGWRHGPVKDAAAKIHPCYVPYQELPEIQKAKDSIFGAVVRAILYAANALPTTINKAEIEQILAASKVTDQKLGVKTTMVHVTLPNGFEMVETSGCVDPDNYDHTMGVSICMKRITDRLWMLEGYRLQSAVAKS